METRLKDHKNFRKPTAITEHLIKQNHDVTLTNVEFLFSRHFDVELLMNAGNILKGYIFKVSLRLTLKMQRRIFYAYFLTCFFSDNIYKLDAK